MNALSYVDTTYVYHSLSIKQPIAKLSILLWRNQSLCSKPLVIHLVITKNTFSGCSSLEPLTYLSSLREFILVSYGWPRTAQGNTGKRSIINHALEEAKLMDSLITGVDDVDLVANENACSGVLWCEWRHLTSNPKHINCVDFPCD